MIVDDHTLFRTGMRMILVQVGEAASITEASSIKEAFDFTDSGVDVILLDIHMPGLNGIDGIKPIRDKFSGVPVIILSASSEVSQMQKAKELGASGFINKASLAEEMVSSISLVLEGKTCFPKGYSTSGKTSYSKNYSGLKTLDPGLWNRDARLQTPDSRLQTSDPGLRNLESRF